LALIPLLNTSIVRTNKFKPILSLLYWFLVSDFFLLGWIGQKPVESPYIEIGFFATLFYFFFFIFLIPIIGYLENKIIFK
jgi:ubiquinol-cytochrome c reductase cytochrome b subunit